METHGPPSGEAAGKRSGTAECGSRGNRIGQSSPRPFDITPQGRIVGVGFPGQSQSDSFGPAQIHVVLNWFEELKTRVPTK